MSAARSVGSSRVRVTCIDANVETRPTPQPEGATFLRAIEGDSQAANANADLAHHQQRSSDSSAYLIVRDLPSAASGSSDRSTPKRGQRVHSAASTNSTCNSSYERPSASASASSSFPAAAAAALAVSSARAAPLSAVGQQHAKPKAHRWSTSLQSHPEPRHLTTPSGTLIGTMPSAASAQVMQTAARSSQRQIPSVPPYNKPISRYQWRRT